MESIKMAEVRQAKQQNKANGKKPFGGKPSEIQVYKDGHKRTEINPKTGEVKIFWKDMLVTPETHSRPRVGKTARDAANGAKRRNFENKQSRVSWQHDSKRSTFNFPYNSCNGKRNRTVVTSKGNERRVIGRAKSATK
jgi:hypothetical protein